MSITSRHVKMPPCVIKPAFARAKLECWCYSDMRFPGICVPPNIYHWGYMFPLKVMWSVEATFSGECFARTSPSLSPSANLIILCSGNICH